jgi:Bacterial Ig-like domain (group 3)
VLLNEPGTNSPEGAPSNGVFTVSPSPSQYGQSVTLSVTMSTASGPIPTGSISFNVDGSFIATSTLSKGVATCTYTSALNTGAHTFVATYNGDSTYAAESFSALQVVTPPIYPTTTVLVASPTSVDTSQTVGLTATVSSTVSVQSGVVTFMDGNSSLGSQSLYQTSTVRLDTNLLSPGTHNLTAVYQGYQQPFIDEQAVYQPSTSAPVTVTVNANATTTALSASVTSLTAG